MTAGFDIDRAIARDEAQLLAQLNSRTVRRSFPRKPGAVDQALASRLRLPMFDNRIVEVSLFRLEDQDPGWPQLHAEDQGEREIAGWLESAQQAALADSLSSEQLQKLDEKIPGWREATLDFGRDEVAGRRDLRRAGVAAREAGLLRTAPTDTRIAA